MSDDLCGARSILPGDKTRASCTLPITHIDNHFDNNLQWTWPNVQPLQERGPVTPPPCGNVSPNRLNRCALDAGHDGQHRSGNSSWPQARSNYRSDQLTGATIDDLIRDLFRRVEQLEQTSAGGAAVDDMFATMNRALERLVGGLGEVEKRMTRLEQAQVYGPGPHDLSALQASIGNHINRALTEFGSVLNTQFERLNGAICTVNGEAQQRHREMDGLFNRVVAQILGELKPAPPVFCGALDNTGILRCEMGPDHGGRHQSGNTSWPNPCGAVHPSLDVTCIVVKEHDAEHLAAYDTRYGRVRWADGQEQYQDLAGHPEECHGEMCVRPDDGAQTERASGSPAAARCPAQFREGQCLGYAGHDGDCSALPDPREPQLEEFEECGMDPSPGHSMPPCGEPRGHDGPCVSGPSPCEDDYPIPFEG